jgi:hypothetical protein
MRLELWNKAMKDIPEKDWKYFRILKENILNRFSKTTLSQINIIIASKEIASKHEKYLKVFEYIMERDEELGNALDNLRRSNAKEKIAVIYQMDLIKPDEFNKFSDETKDFINAINKITT